MTLRRLFQASLMIVSAISRASSTAATEASTDTASPSGPADAAPAGEAIAQAQPGRFVVDAGWARHMAGTWADPVKAVENLPGVARLLERDDGMVLWGAPGGQSRTMVDGVEVPAPLHLGGMRSAIGAHAPSRLELVPGAYGATHGRALGGLVLISTAELPAQGVKAAAEANLVDASAMLAAAPMARLRFGVAGTWSYADRHAGWSDEEVGSFYKAPRYRDFQAKAELDLGPQRRLAALVLGATSSLRRTDALSYASESRFPLQDRTWYRLAVRYTNAGKAATEIAPFIGWTTDDVASSSLPDLQELQQLKAFHYGGRASREFQLARQVVLTLALDALVTRTRAHLQSDGGFPAREGTPQLWVDSPINPVLSTPLRSSWISTLGDLAPSLSLRWQTPRLMIVPAVRMDLFPLFVESESSEPKTRVSHYPLVIGPRLSVAYAPVPTLQVHAAGGLYSQPPHAADLDPSFGNPGLGPSQAGHASLGLRWQLGASVAFDAMTFLRRSWDLPSPAPSGVALVQDGQARAYGAQFMIRGEVAAKLGAWIAYTLSRSEMLLPCVASDWYPARQDRTHVLTGVVAYRWWGWVTSARVRYASGSRFTAVDRFVFDSSISDYRPILGGLNSARLSGFFATDLRIERELVLAGSVIGLFVDVANATGHHNPEAIVYRESGGVPTVHDQAPRTYFFGARWHL